MSEIVTNSVKHTTKNSNKRKHNDDDNDKVTFLEVKHPKELCYYNEK